MKYEKLYIIEKLSTEKDKLIHSYRSYILNSNSNARQCLGDEDICGSELVNLCYTIEYNTLIFPVLFVYMYSMSLL